MACSVALAELASDSSRFTDTAKKHKVLNLKKETAVKVDPLHYIYLQAPMLK